MGGSAIFPLGLSWSNSNHARDHTRGRIEFAESNPYFADNDLGDGSVVVMAYLDGLRQVASMNVQLTWLDWCCCEYESV